MQYNMRYTLWLICNLQFDFIVAKVEVREAAKNKFMREELPNEFREDRDERDTSRPCIRKER